jgi:uncharacterized phiE125 gp8 family phage protein
MSLKLITAPIAPPVTLAEMKAHLRVDMTDDDTLISAMLVGATDVAEQHTGRAIMPQTWEITLDAFPDAFEITRVPVQSITSLKYYDASGVQQTLSPSLYALDNADDFSAAYVVPAFGAEWPETREQINAVTLRYAAGYADATAVPEAIKSWIKLQVSAMYENREAEAYSARAVSTTVKMSFVDGLIARYRIAAL